MPHGASKRTAVVLLLALVFAVSQVCADGWQRGRATFYGTDAWPIHRGSCGYGYLDPGVSTGWDVAALADTNHDYVGSCGICYEVRCRKTSFHDGFGEHLDRNHICRDESASVVVQIVDTCACYYKGNTQSNKRWCCGDMQHFDLSAWAFEKLADKKWGVMGIEFRRVSCGQQPSKPAYAPNPTPKEQFMGDKPWDWSASKDRRHSNSFQWQNSQRSSSGSWSNSGK